MMKTKLLIAALAFASAALVLSSCTREDIDDTLPKGAIRLIADDFQSNAKLGVDSEGAQLHFIAGDTLWINGDSYIVNATTNGTAYILDNNGALEGKAIYAVYPHSIVDATVFDAENPANVKIDLPAAYEYRCDGTSQIVRAPLAAYRQAGNTDALQFQHLTAAVTLKIMPGSNTNPIKLKTIKLSNYNKILASSKNITISDNITMDNFTAGTGSSDITITFGSAENNSCAVGNNTPVYIQIPILPVGRGTDNLSSFTVEVTAGLDLEGSIENFEYYFNRKQNDNTRMTIAQGELAYIPVDMTIGAYTTPATVNVGMQVDGAFSIGNGQKVYLAKSNLKYHVENQTWGFFDNQYTTLETNGLWNTNYGLTVNPGIDGWMSLFIYGSNGDKTNVSPKDLPLTHTQNQNATLPCQNLIANGENYDWGAKVGDNNWFTLSKEQWQYLFNSDRMSPSGAAYHLAAVGNRRGLLVYPDGFWGIQTGLRTGAPSNHGNTIEIETFENLEKVGVVFLPAAGRITDAKTSGKPPKYYNKIENVSETYTDGTCYYWTSTCLTVQDGTQGAYYMQSSSSAVTFNANNFVDNTQKAMSASVRLAHPANF